MIQDNYHNIFERIKRACLRVNRKPSEIQLMAACKGRDVHQIKEAYQCGVRIMGENRAQEAEIHQSQLASLDIEWHYIGKLQKNKINRILKNFYFIQSVDGVKSLENINKRV